MKDINQVTIRGHIGNVRTFGRENNVASISVATTESYKDRNGKWQEITTWHRVKAFASNSAIPPFESLQKGMLVLVNGKLTTNSYTDKDGNERESTEIDAAEIVGIIDLKADYGEQSRPRGNQRQNNYDEDF